MRRLLVDTGPLVALANRRDRRHAEAVDFFNRFDGALITTVAVATEVCALLPRHLGSKFLRSVKGSLFALVHVPEQELPALAALMDKYADRPMDFGDASLLVAQRGLWNPRHRDARQRLRFLPHCARPGVA